MKIFSRFLLIPALGIALLAPGVSAQTLPIAAQLTLQQQDFTTRKGDVFTDRVKATRVTSNGLLTLLGEVYQSEFPNGFPFGSRLVLVNFNYFQVQSAQGAVLVNNASPYMTYSDTYRAGDYLFQGKENTFTEAQSHTFFYQATITFNDPATNGTSFTFTGNVLEKYSKSAAGPGGYRSFQDSLAITGTGSGKTGNSFFLMSGRIFTSVVKWIE
ncbi:MAG: hypothetical protein H7Y43_09055 [Akkermansiaceae bacterium]|nr:hypothetical protein [Verrucomicrobiales bacterium]